MFGGSAADFGLYRKDEGTDVFMSSFDAFLQKLPHAYFPTKEEAEAAGAAASTRGGLVSALEKTIDPKIPTGKISWLIESFHVGTSDEEIAAEIVKRLEKPSEGDREILAQASAYALACHRANQDLVREFRL
jgi:hypothetical protein